MYPFVVFDYERISPFTTSLNLPKSVEPDWNMPQSMSLMGSQILLSIWSNHHSTSIVTTTSCTILLGMHSHAGVVAGVVPSLVIEQIGGVATMLVRYLRCVIFMATKPVQYNGRSVALFVHNFLIFGGCQCTSSQTNFFLLLSRAFFTTTKQCLVVGNGRVQTKNCRQIGCYWPFISAA